MKYFTRHQIAAARGLLGWTQKDLAQAARVSPDLISKIEKGESAGSDKTKRAIFDAFDKNGIDFTDGEGVKRKSADVLVYKGQAGFVDFVRDVYDTVKEGGEIYVSNVNEDDFLKWEGDEAQAHMDRMASVKDLACHFLVQEGDTNIVASNYATYKAIPKENFEQIPLYIYGDKTAIIAFEPTNVEVYVVSHPAITQYFRTRFLETWNKAKDIA